MKCGIKSLRLGFEGRPHLLISRDGGQDDWDKVSDIGEGVIGATALLARGNQCNNAPFDFKGTRYLLLLDKADLSVDL